jgi:nitrite reductase (NADH) large subunit
MRYVIIGNGVAGTTAASFLRDLDTEGHITVVTEESIPFYSRIRLIEYLSKEADAEDIIMKDDEWYNRKNIKVLLNTYISDIDREKKCIATNKGESLPYDRLLLATGGISFIPPIPGSEKKGVFSLRNIRDADEILSYTEDKRKVVIIGGGVLGLEAGNSLRKTGHEVSVIEFFPRLLPRQMDPDGASILKKQMERMGFTFYLNTKSKEIIGDDRAEGVLFEDGRTISGDAIIISAGIRPRAELVKKLGLNIQKGIVVNDRMETSIPDIYAAGDLIEHRDIFYGVWPAAEKQGEIAGINMAEGNASYEGTVISNVLKVVGINLASAGDIDAEGQYNAIVQKDEARYTYKKLVIKDNVLSGCILYGDISGYRNILKAVAGRRNIEDMEEVLKKYNFSIS